MGQTERDRAKLRNRIRRIQGQMESVERALAGEEHDCAQLLMLLAAVRGAVNGLMAEVLEDHVRLHLLGDEAQPVKAEIGEELIDLVRAYLK